MEGAFRQAILPLILVSGLSFSAGAHETTPIGQQHAIQGGKIIQPEQQDRAAHGLPVQRPEANRSESESPTTCQRARLRQARYFAIFMGRPLTDDDLKSSPRHSEGGRRQTLLIGNETQRAIGLSATSQLGAQLRRRLSRRRTGVRWAVKRFSRFAIRKVLYSLIFGAEARARLEGQGYISVATCKTRATPRHVRSRESGGYCQGQPDFATF